MKSISCICPTFNRIDTLEECIESFLRQDYEGNKELIIANNFLNHTLVYPHPEVTIFNSDQTTLGGIVNDAISRSRYELIAPWEDDDIYLSHNLSMRAKNLGDNDATLISSAFFSGCNNNDVDRSREPMHNTLHGQMIFTRDIFDRVSGYPCVWRAHDTQFIKRIQDHPGSKISVYQPNSKEDISYIYRWALKKGQRNLSSFFSSHETPECILNKIMEYREEQKMLQPTPQTIYLTPHWKKDYEV